MSFKASIAGVLALLLVIFTAQNADIVEIRFLFWKVEMSRAIVLFGVFGTGAILGWLVSSLSRLSAKEQE